MKKRISLLMIGMIMFLFCSCGSTSSVSREEYDAVVAERDSYKAQLDELNSLIVESEHVGGPDRNEVNDPAEMSNSNDDGDKTEIIAEYTLADSIGWYTRHFIIVKNNSNDTVDIATSSLAYSHDGTMVSAADGSFDALGAGCISVFYEAFETDKEIDYYETDIKTAKSSYYESVIQDLTYVQNDIEDGAIFQVTNNGDQSAEFVEGYALFFKNNELVSYESAYFTDDDSEIKPGKTISKQMTSNNEFDNIEFYLTGRR